jgi:predicted Fe-Mo cluster-binding NifX family protein
MSGDGSMDARRKIAIPTFETRVSPRFDCAAAVLVVTVDNGNPSGREELAASDWAPHERVNRLLKCGVDTVICGSVESLQSAGVTIYGWVTGDVEDALGALLRGDLDSEAAINGGACCGCRCFPGDQAMRARAVASGVRRGRGPGRGSGRKGEKAGSRPRGSQGRRGLK